MSRKVTPFFATHGDLVTIAREVMEVRPVDFVPGGLFTGPMLAAHPDIDDLSAFEAYLIVDHGIPVNLRAVPQRAGGQLYAVDQTNNAHTIALKTGGALADQQLIAGQVGTVGNAKQSDELYALFATIIRKRFEKVKSFYVGPEAAVMLDNGARLSATPKSPRTFDLVR